MSTPSSAKLAFSPETSFLVTEQQVSTQLKQDTVILNLANGKYYSFEGTGSHIWQAVQAGKSVSEIETQISTLYKVSEELCKEDIEAFLTSLVHADLIAVKA